MTTVPVPPVQQILRRKAMLAAIRDRARVLFDTGTPGIQIASAICESTDELLRTLISETAASFSPDAEQRLAGQGAILAVGGTGRGELAPYSDIDLLFLQERGSTPEFQEFVARFVQNCWDSGIQLGHAGRDLPTCIALARQDPQIATALVEARRLWGCQKASDKLIAQYRRDVVQSRKRQFIDSCLAARSEGWTADGPPAQELEPDVKASSGGLRDLHLIRWIAFARYGVKDIDSLRLKGGIDRADARKLKDAWEFLTRLRIDLHLSAGKSQDRLTRDEQLRIARNRGFVATAEQRPVEQFMQEYFHYSSELAAITRRFAALERPRTFAVAVRDALFSHRAEGILHVGPDRIDVAARNLPKVCQSVEWMLRAYKASALYNVPLAPRVTEAIKQATSTIDRTISDESARLFVDIMRCTQSLGQVMRSMFNTHLLDIVIPDMTHIRNLLQFNQYHHFTVDEHTLRAIETVTSYQNDDGPIGSAYRHIPRKELLHLAVLLHDIGKGFEEDHCTLGQRIGLRIGERLRLPAYQVEQLGLLIRKHLEMADLAFRRDVTDAKLVLDFSRDIGSPEMLRMLYVLTAADVTSVGPGTWTNWKAGLLEELFDRCLVILSGKRYSYHEEERMLAIKQDVARQLQQRGDASASIDQVSRRLRGFSAYYLTGTRPEQIANDLLAIEQLKPDEINVAFTWSEETGSAEYRIIIPNTNAASGCFHKMAGVLAVKGLEILSADVNTTADGVIVDSYRVVDSDFEGRPPDDRFEEVAQAFRDVLNDRVTVESLFKRYRRFGRNQSPGPVSDLPTRVRIDNHSAETRTIVDVFAHDRPGLLHTVASTLYDLGLSVDMAKIATHFDQVVDVFYVQESDGVKVRSEDRIREIHDTMMQSLQRFEEASRRQAVSGK